jgi:hypothetical protein
MAGDGGEGAVMEDGAAPFEQRLLLKLGGPAGPAELVEAVAPDGRAGRVDGSKFEQGGREVRQLPGSDGEASICRCRPGQ